MTIQQRYDDVLAWFEANMQDAESELVFTSAYELLVAVMLSAQCTDKRVNMVTPSLFAAYPDVQALAGATKEEVLVYIHSVSYPNAKADHLVRMARMLVEDYGGEVPRDREALQTLPGVGRKTANVVCAVWWKQPTMAVDTHIFRVAERIGLSKNAKTPLDTELQLIRYIPEELIPKAHHWILLHGRYICQARSPHCDRCGIKSRCQYYMKRSKKQGNV